MLEDQRTLLESLEGWVWDARDALWEERFSQLEQFAKTHGHARVPKSFTTSDGDKLGLWVGTQRLTKAQLPQEKRARLEALKSWVWDTHEAAWEKGFTQLKEFVTAHGHARVPTAYTTPDGYRLGMWVGGAADPEAQVVPGAADAT